MLDMIPIKAIPSIVNLDTVKVYGYASTGSYIVDDGKNMFQVFEIHGLQNANGWNYDSRNLVFQDCNDTYYKEVFAKVEKDRKYWENIKPDIEVDAKSFIGNLGNDQFIVANMDDNNFICKLAPEEVKVNEFDDMVIELNSTCAYEPWLIRGVSARDLINGKIGEWFEVDGRMSNGRAVDDESAVIIEKFDNTVLVMIQKYTTTDEDDPQPSVEETLIRFIIINREDGYVDELGGFHSGGTGTDPNGQECGECSHRSCADCDIWR